MASRNDATLLAALVSGATYAQAAEVAGLSQRTVTRRMADPDFRARFEEARDAAAREAADALVAALTTTARVLGSAQGAAASAMLQLLRSDDEGTRFRAAKDLLDRGERRAADLMEVRLAELEDRLDSIESTEAPRLRVVERW